MKILIADDDPIMLRTLELKLKREGHQVITSSDGREALKEIETCSAYLIITDIMMPFSSGLEIVAKVKNSGKNIPVIVLSAMGQENVVMEAFKLGADDYITKPFSPNELSMRIKRLFPVVS